MILPEVHQELGLILLWLQVEIPSNEALVRSLQLVIDDGKAESIALAYEKRWRVILDDYYAQKVAQRLGVW